MRLKESAVCARIVKHRRFASNSVIDVGCSGGMVRSVPDRFRYLIYILQKINKNAVMALCEV